MSTMTQAPERRSAAHTPQAGPNLIRSLRSEWIKFRSVPSTAILSAVVIVIIVGIGALGSWGFTSSITVQEGAPPFDPNNPQQSQMAMSADQVREIAPTVMSSGAMFGILFVASLAVVFIASEYSTGSIRSTFLAAPKRTSVLVAKAIVLFVAGAIIALISSFLAYLVGNIFFSAKGASIALDTEGLLPMFGYTALYFALVAVMAVAFGSIIRNTAGGIVVAVSVLFVLQMVADILGMTLDWVQEAGRFLPGAGGNAMMRIGEAGDGDLTQWQGLLVVLAWAIIPLIGALVLQKFRDIK